MKRRIYTDTSAIGGCFDEKFAAESLKLFDRFRAGLDILVLSDLTLAEVEPAPQEIQDIVTGMPPDRIENVEFDQEASELADEYIRSQVISKRSLADAQHIATATVARVDVLVSWNFKHIVNLPRIQGYNSVNLRLGYPLLEIRSPQEVFLDEN